MILVRTLMTMKQFALSVLMATCLKMENVLNIVIQHARVVYLKMISTFVNLVVRISIIIN